MKVEWVSQRTEALPDVTEKLIAEHGDHWVAILSGSDVLRWYHQFAGVFTLQAVIMANGFSVIRGATDLYLYCSQLETDSMNPLPADVLSEIDARLPDGWRVDFNKPSYEALVCVEHTRWGDGVLIWENSD